MMQERCFRDMFYWDLLGPNNKCIPRTMMAILFRYNISMILIHLSLTTVTMNSFNSIYPAACHGQEQSRGVTLTVVLWFLRGYVLGILSIMAHKDHLRT